MVAMRQIKNAAREIARQFQPQRVMLFGSYAQGKATRNSDVDFLVLMPGRSVHDRALEIRRAIEFPFPVDVLVRSPEEFHRRVAAGDCFLKEIEKNGTVLYEASHARMGKKGGRGLRNRAARAARKKVS